MAFAVIAGIFSAAAAFSQGTAEAAGYEMQAQAADYQARVADINAQASAQQYSAEEERVRRESRQVMGAQRAAIAQSGVGFGGSSQDVMRQSSIQAELDALNIRYAGSLERTGLLNEAGAQRFNAATARSSAKMARRMRWVSAIGAGLGGYSSAGGKTIMGGTSASTRSVSTGVSAMGRGIVGRGRG